MGLPIARRRVFLAFIAVLLFGFGGAATGESPAKVDQGSGVKLFGVDISAIVGLAGGAVGLVSGAYSFLDKLSKDADKRTKRVRPIAIKIRNEYVYREKQQELKQRNQPRRLHNRVIVTVENISGEPVTITEPCIIDVVSGTEIPLKSEGQFPLRLVINAVHESYQDMDEIFDYYKSQDEIDLRGRCRITRYDRAFESDPIVFEKEKIRRKFWQYDDAGNETGSGYRTQTEFRRQ